VDPDHEAVISPTTYLPPKARRSKHILPYQARLIRPYFPGTYLRKQSRGSWDGNSGQRRSAGGGGKGHHRQRRLAESRLWPTVSRL